MADIFWYISADKIPMLKDPKSRFSWKELSLKLKLKFFEAETAVGVKDSLVRDLKTLKEELARDHNIVPFQDLQPGGVGAIFSFEGEGARLLTPEALWVATENANSALLLVGAPRNLAGISQLKEGSMSPSMDPVGAVKAVAQNEKPSHLLAALHYAWSEVMRDAIAGGSHFPRIEGLAILAGVFEAKPAFKGRDRLTINQIVLGSPVYVRQT